MKSVLAFWNLKRVIIMGSWWYFKSCRNLKVLSRKWFDSKEAIDKFRLRLRLSTNNKYLDNIKSLDENWAYMLIKKNNNNNEHQFFWQWSSVLWMQKSIGRSNKVIGIKVVISLLVIHSIVQDHYKISWYLSPYARLSNIISV